MFSFNKKPKFSDKDDITSNVVETSVDMAKAMVRPYLEQIVDGTVEVQRDMISHLILSLSLALSVLAATYLKSTPEEFGEHIKEFIVVSMKRIVRIENGQSSNETKAKSFQWRAPKSSSIN